MKILQVHNDYGKLSGEEVVVDQYTRLLRSRGHDVEQFRREGLDASTRLMDCTKAFFSGLYNPYARQLFRRKAMNFKPDIIHVHNLYPMLSPSIIDEAERLRIPIVMTLHNYRLLCPSGLCLSHGRVCTDCLSRGRELNCILHNCERDLTKSIGYAARNAVARFRRVFSTKVRHFIALSEFQKKMCTRAGIPVSRISVIPNMVDEEIVGIGTSNAAAGSHVLYVGRLSPEKGVQHIVEVARKLPDIPFLFVGDHARMPDLVNCAPANCRFLGFVPRGNDLWRYYDEARFVVTGSLWFEAFPLNALEAMARSRALICTRIGASPEIVDEGKTGLLYRPGDEAELSEKICFLWEHADVSNEMGRAGQQRWRDRFSSEAHYAALTQVYESTIQNF